MQLRNTIEAKLHTYASIYVQCICAHCLDCLYSFNGLVSLLLVHGQSVWMYGLYGLVSLYGKSVWSQWFVYIVCSLSIVILNGLYFCLVCLLLVWLV
jgi:hypothetical protein